MSDVALSQGYAVSLEHTLWGVFSCERFGVGGIVNSDYIRKYPIASMIHAATYVYANANLKQRETIENFIENVTWYSRWSIDDLLSFGSKENVINGTTYTLEFDDGKQQLEHIIKEFENVIHK